MPIYFIINGAFSTFVHYFILFVIFDVMNLFTAGVSSLIASFFASLFSFFGNKLFVFNAAINSTTLQITRFTLLYLLVALFHGFFLLTWTDMLDLNYKIGFLLAVSFQVLIGYFGNKYYVFRL